MLAQAVPLHLLGFAFLLSPSLSLSLSLSLPISLFRLASERSASKRRQVHVQGPKRSRRWILLRPHKVQTIHGARAVEQCAIMVRAGGCVKDRSAHVSVSCSHKLQTLD